MITRVSQSPVTPHVEKRSTNEAANILFDLGKTHFDQFRGTNFVLAADYFKRAIQADTNFAQAYGYLAATYFWTDEGWNPGWRFLPQAREFALQALSLDESLAIPHLALGWYHTMREWAWSDAEKRIKRAIQLNPSSAFCHLSYAEFLRLAGRLPEALQEITAAKTLDPHSGIINIRLAAYLADARQYAKALIQIDQLAAMVGPDRVPAYVHYVQKDVLCALERFGEAIESELKARTAMGEWDEEA